jgi:hypothetical protein
MNRIIFTSGSKPRAHYLLEIQQSRVAGRKTSVIFDLQINRVMYQIHET